MIEQDDAARRGARLLGFESHTMNDLLDHLSWAICAELESHSKGRVSEVIDNVVRHDRSGTYGQR